MGKKVRVWICWRFHWLTVGTDKWGPPSFTIWPTATFFLIKCSIIERACLNMSWPIQTGSRWRVPYWNQSTPRMGSIVLRDWEESLPSHGTDTSQPCSYQPCTHPSPDCFGRNIFSGFSAAGSPGSLFDHLDQLLYYHRLFTLPVRAVWKPKWC